MSKRSADNHRFDQILASGQTKSDQHRQSHTRRKVGFDQLDGWHSYQDNVPEGCVLYPVRRLERGQVIWFNFHLAKEMGLIPNSHPNQLTESLEKKVIETFSLQIVNEYDQARQQHLQTGSVLPNKYMATRYLQLQHKDKRGLSSGDGRSIWNGCIEFNGKKWDVSSRGTGVTRLSPGAAEAGRYLQTGNEDFGYGCGLADTSEMMGAALFSEIFHRSGIPTERTLAVIDLGKGVGIGVRAAQNLLRPAHFFLWLKQNKRDVLTRSFDQFIIRQIENKKWDFSASSKSRYQRALLEIATSMAKFSALLERRYIFAWLDWDGDNLLADAGIIDYGSIRQFGIRHDQYRYDDVDRFSTNLNEQKRKARLTVQVFAQMIHYIESGQKRPVARFKRSTACLLFDREFEKARLEEFTVELGLNAEQAKRVMSQNQEQLVQLFQLHSKLESEKTRAPVQKVPDGINRPPIWNIRRVNRELAAKWADRENQHGLPGLDWFIDTARSQFAKRYDLKRTARREKVWAQYLLKYDSVMRVALGTNPNSSTLHQWVKRVEKANLEARMTGNASEYILDEVFRARKRGVAVTDILAALDHYIELQTPFSPIRSGLRALPKTAGQLLTAFVNLSLEHEEEI